MSGSKVGFVMMSRNRVKILQWSVAGVAMAGLAFSPAISAILSGQDSDVSLSTRGNVGSFTPALVDPDLLAQFESMSASRKNRDFRFTPAGQDKDRNRAVTIVVRSSSARAIGFRNGLSSGETGKGSPLSAKITPTSYSLGTAKGWKKFALREKALPMGNLGEGMPDLAEFGAKQKGKSDDDSRFSASLSIDADTPTGTAPRSLSDSQQDMSVDVEGSYALTRNLNVTAGVRIGNERDRMAPLTDSRQDSQAVYVGTRFSF